MSIIHDALKKTQKNLKNIEHHNISKNNKQNALEDNPPEKREHTNEFSDIHISPSAIILSCLIASVIILTTNTVLYYLKTRASSHSIKPTSKSSITQNPVVSNIKEQAISEPNHKTQPTERALVLNGTLMAEDKRAALINNEVYEIGESIDDKFITSISLNEVELLDKNGLITTIKVKK